MKTNIPFDKHMVIRTAVLAVALFNQLLVNAGYSPLPFDDHGIEIAVTTTFTLSTAIWAWWSNNAVTRNARQAEQLAARKGLK